MYQEQMYRGTNLLGSNVSGATESLIRSIISQDDMFIITTEIMYEPLNYLIAI